MSEPTYEELQTNYLRAKKAAKAAHGKAGIRTQIAANQAMYNAKALYQKRLTRMIMS